MYQRYKVEYGYFVMDLVCGEDRFFTDLGDAHVYEAHLLKYLTKDDVKRIEGFALLRGEEVVGFYDEEIKAHKAAFFALLKENRIE